MHRRFHKCANALVMDCNEPVVNWLNKETELNVSLVIEIVDSYCGKF